MHHKQIAAQAFSGQGIQNMLGSIGGPIIDSNNFNVVEFRFLNDRANAFDCLANGIFFVVAGNDDRCLHCLHHLDGL